MTPLPVCILYTRDPDVARRVRGALVTAVRVFEASDAATADSLMTQYGPAVWLADVRDGRGGEEVLDLMRRWPDSVCVALGDRRSDPLRAVVRNGAFAAEDLDPGGNCDRPGKRRGGSDADDAPPFRGRCREAVGKVG